MDLEEFKYGGTNISSIQLVDPDRPEVIDVTNDWFEQDLIDGQSPLENERGIRVSSLEKMEYILSME